MSNEWGIISKTNSCIIRRRSYLKSFENCVIGFYLQTLHFWLRQEHFIIINLIIQPRDRKVYNMTCWLITEIKIWMFRCTAYIILCADKRCFHFQIPYFNLFLIPYEKLTFGSNTRFPRIPVAFYIIRTLSLRGCCSRRSWRSAMPKKTRSRRWRRERSSTS